jgi:hypothetical protein
MAHCLDRSSERLVWDSQRSTPSRSAPRSFPNSSCEACVGEETPSWLCDGVQWAEGTRMLRVVDVTVACCHCGADRSSGAAPLCSPTGQPRGVLNEAVQERSSDSTLPCLCLQTLDKLAAAPSPPATGHLLLLWPPRLLATTKMASPLTQSPVAAPHSLGASASSQGSPNVAVGPLSPDQVEGLVYDRFMQVSD